MILRRLIFLLERIERKTNRVTKKNYKYRREIDYKTVQEKKIDFVNPVFVLSTGRCGTLWLTEFCKLSSRVFVNHSLPPQLIRNSRLAYEKFQECQDDFGEIIRAARDDFILDSYKMGKLYLETNNRITFFAYAIKDVYPNSKFIHIIRNPGDFVRSGLSRNWYKGHHHDIGRIIMYKNLKKWNLMSTLEKIAWLWNETNNFIEQFLKKIDEKNYIRVRSEDLFSHQKFAIHVLKFLKIEDIPESKVKKLVKKRINKQDTLLIGPYETWSEEQKEQLTRQANLAGKYGYEL